MDELFGVSMTTIMLVLLALFAVALASVAAIALINRTMFRMGLRNIPRRGAQTTLIVLGLMLSTLIITAAFSTGDTLNYSITSQAYNLLQRTDLRLFYRAAGTSDSDASSLFSDSAIYLDESIVGRLEAAFANDPAIEGFIPRLVEPVPALNPDARLSEPAVFLSGTDVTRLSRLGGLRLLNGEPANLASLGPNEAFASERAADKLALQAGSRLQLFTQSEQAEVLIKAVVRDESASGVIGGGNPDVPGGLALRLSDVQRLTNHPGQISAVNVALAGGVRGGAERSDAVAQRLEEYVTSDAGRAALGLGEGSLRVDKIKQRLVEQAELFGSLFTTVFLVLGLFSIAAGVLLIFMIFVMLAAERRMEMGMARAVGAQRSHLLQSFIAEGMAYNLLAGLIGAALGVAVAYFLVVQGTKLVVGEALDFFSFQVTPRSLIVSYCLGAVVTFITVAFSSLRVSRLNIVAAIRGTDDVKGRERRRGVSGKWIVLGLVLLVIPPVGLWLLLRRGLGLPTAWILGPAAIISGGALIALARGWNQAFPFTLGVSLLPLGAAALARYFRAPSRAVWTAVGLFLLVFWLSPIEFDRLLLGKTLSGNIEMFVLSGIMIVTAATLVIVFNARLLTTLFERPSAGHAYRVPVLLAALAVAALGGGALLGDRAEGLGQLFYLLAVVVALGAALSFAAVRYPRFAPALKMGVAYPLASRFRTGMTIAMFSLIIFSLTVMSVLNANFGALFSGDETRGGWDVIADTNRNNPVPDLRAALREAGSFDVGQIDALGRTGSFRGQSEVREPGKSEAWTAYDVRAGDDAFWQALTTKLQSRATGYESDAAVYERVRAGSGFAVMDVAPLGQAGFGPPGWKTSTIKLTDKTFAPFTVEVRDPTSGRVGTLTIIGVFSSRVSTDVLSGIYTNSDSFAQVYGRPDFRRNYLRLTPGADSAAVAKGIRAALVTRGVQANSIAERLDEQQRLGRGFNRIFQAFMGLGLLVGIAALGVIALRSVVERRQQIGMLRALGFQRGTVALTFVLEASFVAVMGILSGVVGAAILSRNLLSSEEFTGSSGGGFRFFIPWPEVLLFVVLGYLFAMLMTWWPSRGAARVPIAEALRYE